MLEMFLTTYLAAITVLSVKSEEMLFVCVRAQIISTGVTPLGVL